ncbi:MAG: mycofactocin biosynthesis chaperone MftB [Actinobacteria bacterium]|nr:mycofactocin biosynthesis chaperone MftB [Actinomycetota bacterium]
MATTVAALEQINLNRAMELHPEVALRDESFGALAYHYGNRRLVFLKSRPLASPSWLTVSNSALRPPSASLGNSPMPATWPACIA